MVIDYLIFRRAWERSALSGCAELLPFSLLFFCYCSGIALLIYSELLAAAHFASVRLRGVVSRFLCRIFLLPT
jgi:hypothetical protein